MKKITWEEFYKYYLSEREEDSFVSLDDIRLCMEELGLIEDDGAMSPECLEALDEMYGVRATDSHAESDLTKCPNCGGPADNGHDRCVPPNPYWCTKCEKIKKV